MRQGQATRAHRAEEWDTSLPDSALGTSWLAVALWKLRILSRLEQAFCRGWPSFYLCDLSVLHSNMEIIMSLSIGAEMKHDKYKANSAGLACVQYPSMVADT